MLYGAISTCRQAGGKFAIVSPGLGFAGSVDGGGGCNIASVNQGSRSWPHPSPDSGGGCGSHCGLPGGQNIRMWK